MNSHHIRSDVWVVLQLDSTIRLGPFPLGTFYHSRPQNRRALLQLGLLLLPWRPRWGHSSPRGTQPTGPRPFRGAGRAGGSRGPSPGGCRPRGPVPQRRARLWPVPGPVAARGRAPAVKSRCSLRLLFTAIPVQVLLLQK